LLALRLKQPHWELTPDEAKRVDAAIKKVQKHYPLAVSQKQLDIAMAIYVVADVYAPRVVSSIVQAKKSKRSENVTPIRSDFGFPMPPGTRN
jgi:hypothetical protein